MKTFHIVFRPEPSGGFTALVPSLPGCISYGETLEEAQTMIDEAIALYLETMAEKNEAYTDDSVTFLRTKSYA